MKRAGRLLAVILMLGVSSCTSPEALRSRGSGPGADVGNLGAIVTLHAGADPYYQTPCRIPSDACTPDADGKR